MSGSASFSRSAFLGGKSRLNFDTKFELVLKPKEFKEGKFGYQGSKPNQSVHFSVKGKKHHGRVMVSSIGNLRGAPIAKKAFLKQAKNIRLSKLKETETVEFSSGSLGWKSTWEEDVAVAGHKFKVRMNLNVVLKGTKKDDHDDDAHDSQNDRKRSSEDTDSDSDEGRNGWGLLGLFCC